MLHLVIYLLFASFINNPVVHSEEFDRKPIYKYHYETDNVMKTAESQIPVHGYHVVEGGYYPGEGPIGYNKFPGGAISYGPSAIGLHGAGIGGAGLGYSSGGIGHGGAGLGYSSGGIGHGGAGLGYSSGGIGHGGAGLGYSAGGIGLGGAGLGYSSGGIGRGGVGGSYVAPIYHHGYGGNEFKKFSEGKEGLNDERFEKAHGQSGEQLHHGQEGFNAGKVAVKEVKGESGHYNDAVGGKKLVEDGKSYHGGQHFNSEGKNGGEQSAKQGHKKGHVIKGFKTSHHKDETGKTEEFYDEANDEGGHVTFTGQQGSFGENGGSSFKGGHEDGHFNAGEKQNSGHYSSGHLVDKTNADQGKYGENKFQDKGVVFGTNNGVDSQSLLGHQEASHYYKHQPVPFYNHHY